MHTVASALPLLIRRARTTAGLTQAELAGRAGVARSAVSAYELGRRHPRLRVAERLVAAAGLRLRLELAPEGDDRPDPFSPGPLPATRDPGPSGLPVMLAAVAEEFTRAGLPHRISGPAAARLHGADVHADALDVDVPDHPDLVEPVCAVLRGMWLRPWDPGRARWLEPDRLTPELLGSAPVTRLFAVFHDIRVHRVPLDTCRRAGTALVDGVVVRVAPAARPERSAAA